MSVQIKTGMRLRSAACATEVIVVRSANSDLDLRCGGYPMVPAGSADTEPVEKLQPQPGFDQPTLLGKRYADESDALELLCCVGGTSTLSLGDELLSAKGPRPLPASD